MVGLECDAVFSDGKEFIKRLLPEATDGICRCRDLDRGLWLGTSLSRKQGCPAHGGKILAAVEGIAGRVKTGFVFLARVRFGRGVLLRSFALVRSVRWFISEIQGEDGRCELWDCEDGLSWVFETEICHEVDGIVLPQNEWAQQAACRTAARELCVKERLHRLRIKSGRTLRSLVDTGRALAREVALDVLVELYLDMVFMVSCRDRLQRPFEV